MMIEATKLINLPLGALDTESKIGEIREILVDPENGRILGFLVQPQSSYFGGSIFSPKKALSIVDVREWDPKGLVTASIENLVNPNEIIRIKDVLQKNIILIGMKAKTESGKGLGSVEDLLIDTDTESVAKYYLKDLLGEKRVLTSDKVVKIDKVIVFHDDVAEAPPGVAGVPA